MESKHVLRLAEENDKKSLGYDGPPPPAMNCLSPEKQTLNLLHAWLFGSLPSLLLQWILQFLNDTLYLLISGR